MNKAKKSEKKTTNFDCENSLKQFGYGFNSTHLNYYNLDSLHWILRFIGLINKQRYIYIYIYLYIYIYVCILIYNFNRAKAELVFLTNSILFQNGKVKPSPSTTKLRKDGILKFRK